VKEENSAARKPERGHIKVELKSKEMRTSWVTSMKQPIALTMLQGLEDDL